MRFKNGKLVKDDAFPTGQVVTVDPQIAVQWMQSGSRFIRQNEAALLWNTAATMTGAKAREAVAVLTAGAVIAAVDEVVTKLCGAPPNPAEPFAALPDWAVAIFTRLGVIPPPKSEVAGDDKPRPVESRAEMVERAANAGIVLA